jgi:hypothetical protein
MHGKHGLTHTGEIAACGFTFLHFAINELGVVFETIGNGARLKKAIFKTSISKGKIGEINILEGTLVEVRILQNGNGFH